MTSQDDPARDIRMLNLKLEVPRQRTRLVIRPRLLRRLESGDGVAARLCLVIASAGYGKTTLLAQWAAALEHVAQPVAWLTLDDADGDPKLFLSYVIFALRAAGIDLWRLLPHAEQGLIDTTPEACLLLLAEVLSQPGQPVVLILDDYHRAANRVLDALLLKMVRLLPPRLVLVVSARSRPNIGVPQLVVSGLAHELDAEALRLTRPETQELFEGDLTEAGLADIIQTTEGWPVALQLTRLVARTGSAPAFPPDTLSMRGGYLSSYLADRVMGTLSESLVDFLTETALVEKFNIPLADAIRESDDSAALLEELEPLQSLLTPLASEDGWFRYHHLFQDHLRLLLMRRRPHDAPALHLRASRWFERHGHTLEAVRHARGAGAFATCARLIEEAGGWRLILYGGINHLRTLLSLIPEPERLKYPRMLIAESYLKLKDGKISAARNLLELAGIDPLSGRTAPASASEGDAQCDAINVGFLLEGYRDNSLSRQLRDAGVAIRARLPQEDALSHGVLLCVEVLSSLRLGRLDQAEADARLAMRHMRVAHTVLGINYCLMHLGVIALYKGELDVASDHLGRAQAMAVENFGADGGLKQIADILQDAVTLWRSGTIADGAHLSRRFLQEADEQDGWLDVYAANIDVRFHAAQIAGRELDKQHVLEDAHALLRARAIDRLTPIIQARRLEQAMDRRDAAEAGDVAARLLGLLAPGCWRHSPELWRPLQDAGYALLRWLDEHDRPRALALAQDLVACSEAAGSGLYLVRALARCASILERMGRRTQASDALTRALELAAPHGIRRPFLETGELRILLQAVRHAPGAAGSGVMDFVQDLLSAPSAAAGTAPPAVGAVLSVRELEVVRQLTLGLTNKEIGRSLRMTDHTVKFHVRNIFAKLGVERRAHAITMFQRMSGGSA